MSIKSSDIIDDFPIGSSGDNLDSVRSDLSSILGSISKVEVLISRSEEDNLIDELKLKNDPLSQKMIKYYNMSDLSREKGNPLKLLVDQIKNVNDFNMFDLIKIPEIVGIYETFDLLGYPLSHPARDQSATYYLNNNKILRTHITTAWYYYFTDMKVREKLQEKGEIGALCYGKVYRKDDASKNHFPVFHQFEGLYVCSKDKQYLTEAFLHKIALNILHSVYGNTIEIKIKNYKFAYADQSIKVSIKFGDIWLEVIGASVMNGTVLDELGIESKKYNGWSLGIGLERLAMIKKGIPDVRILWSKDPRILKQWGDLENKYEEVSKYPNTYRDISFIIPKEVSLNGLFDTIRDEAGGLVEEVSQLDKYENEKKFGKDKVSYTYRIVYRSHERTLTNEEINDIQSKIRDVFVKRGIILR